MNQNYLVHYGVLGMKWGVRKNRTTTSIKGMMAKRANAKIDKNFKKWKEEDAKKSNAIDLGKKANLDTLAYERNRSDKNLKVQYKQSVKAYKKALKTNTTYRKGQIKQEVGSDLSRKYLSEAKKVKKQLDANPQDKVLVKQYSSLMNNYNIERASARRAAEVGAKRSTKIASLKRQRTMLVKNATITAGFAVGTVAVNSYLQKSGKRGIKSQVLRDVVNVGKTALDFAGYFY